MNRASFLTYEKQDKNSSKSTVFSTNKAPKVVAFPRVEQSHVITSYAKRPITNMEDLKRVAAYLYRECDHKYLLGFILGVNLGLRINELIVLRQQDLFWGDGTVKYIEDIRDTRDEIVIYQCKTRTPRRFFLNAACVEALEQFFSFKEKNKGDVFILPSREGGHVEATTFRKILTKAARDCGLESISTHSMRKTFAYWQSLTPSQCVERDIEKVQRLFGHRYVTTTLNYVGISAQDDKSEYHNVSLHILGEIFET